MNVEEQLMNLRHSCELLIEDLLKISIEKNYILPSYKMSVYAQNQNSFYYCNNLGVNTLKNAYEQKENDIISSQFGYANCQVHVIIHNNFVFQGLFFQALIDSFLNYITIIADDIELKSGIKRLIPELDYSLIATNIANYIVNNLVLGYSFDLISNISALTYEGAKCTGSISFCDEVPELALEFSESFLINRSNMRQTRKLLELAKGEYVLVENELMIKGVAKSDVKCKCKIKFIGNMAWQLWKDDDLIFTYRQGIYVAPFNENLEYLFHIELQREFDLFAKEKISNVYSSILNCSHGALMIILDDAAKESHRLSSVNRGITLKMNSIDQNLIESMASIDGAVLVDLNGNVHGIGIILDGKAEIPGSVSRGARYNSALTYVYEKALSKTRCLAVIFSEDKTIDVISTNHFEGKGSSL